MDYKYGDLYKKYDMDGDIHIGTGIVKVHDIFNPLPDFMKQADVIFSDPPCSKANLNSFYTKADLKAENESYQPFNLRFWGVIDTINPKTIFLEVFKANKEEFLREASERYSNINVYLSMYYNKPSNHCWIIVASNDDLPEYPFEGMDEEKVIEYICKNVEYSCIGDPCMGKGLVAYYSNKYGKKFVGTELNKYRLAVCCERVTTNTRGKIN